MHRDWSGPPPAERSVCPAAMIFGAYFSIPRGQWRGRHTETDGPRWTGSAGGTSLSGRSAPPAPRRTHAGSSWLMRVNEGVQEIMDAVSPVCPCPCAHARPSASCMIHVARAGALIPSSETLVGSARSQPAGGGRGEGRGGATPTQHTCRRGRSAAPSSQLRRQRQCPPQTAACTRLERRPRQGAGTARGRSPLNLLCRRSADCGPRC